MHLKAEHSVSDPFLAALHIVDAVLASIRRYCSEQKKLPSLFGEQKLLKLLTVVPLSGGSKLELLWAVFAKLPYTSSYSDALVCVSITV